MKPQDNSNSGLFDTLTGQAMTLLENPSPQNFADNWLVLVMLMLLASCIYYFGGWLMASLLDSLIPKRSLYSNGGADVITPIIFRITLFLAIVAVMSVAAEAEVNQLLSAVGKITKSG